MAYRILFAVLLFAGSTPADVRLPKILQSHMVLQQQSNVKIRGWAEPNEIVTVSADWIDQAVETKTSPDGTWQVNLATIEAGGPHQITISGRKIIRFRSGPSDRLWTRVGPAVAAGRARRGDLSGS